MNLALFHQAFSAYKNSLEVDNATAKLFDEWCAAMEVILHSFTEERL